MIKKNRTIDIGCIVKWDGKIDKVTFWGAKSKIFLQYHCECSNFNPKHIYIIQPSIKKKNIILFLLVNYCILMYLEIIILCIYNFLILYRCLFGVFFHHTLALASLKFWLHPLLSTHLILLLEWNFLMQILILKYVGSKNSTAPIHFIQSPRPMPRRKKHPGMNKGSPSCQETSPRTILSSANRNRKKEGRHAFKDSLPGHPKQKGLTQWASHGSMVKEQFQERLSPPH